MLKIGITGGIGSGKSLICKIFSSFNIPVFYADVEARKILMNDINVHEQLKSLFGSNIIDEQGIPDKVAISAQVFNNKDLLEQLNRLIHPRVKEKFSAWSKQQNSACTVYEAAIMIESGSYKLMDKIIMVYSEKELRIQRIMKRNGFSRQHIENIMNNQMDEEEKCKKADYILHNNEKTLLLPQIIDLHNKLISLA